MKKLLPLLTLCLLCACCAFGFAACEDTSGENDTPDTPHIHTFTDTVIAPTCTEQGYTTFTCVKCEYSYTDNYINATGHKFTTYVSDNNATYESDGTKTACCDNGCGAKDTVIDTGSKLVRSGITFNTLNGSGTNVNGKVSNSQNTFSFLNEISVSGGATYSVSYDINGNNTIPTKTANLNIGDNVFYVLEMIDGEASNLFTLTIRRRPIYTVSFNSNGGTSVASQQIEEDGFATEPTEKPTKSGYNFACWNYDFSTPIITDTTIVASWKANTNIPYKVEYYLQNLEDDNYTLEYTDYLTGTSDTKATAQIKTYEHFTVKENPVSANISPNGSTVLKVYYTRNIYTVKISTSENITLNKYYDGQYKYGYTIPDITANFNNYLGYEWKGWFSNDEFISSNYIMPSFSIDKNINYIATCIVKNEMTNFVFSSNDITCSISDIKDKNITEIVVPDYVTHIDAGAFRDCNFVETIKVPFSGKQINSDGYEQHWAYIFGFDIRRSKLNGVSYGIYDATIVLTPTKNTKTVTLYTTTFTTSFSVTIDYFAASVNPCVQGDYKNLQVNHMTTYKSGSKTYFVWTFDIELYIYYDYYVPSSLHTIIIGNDTIIVSN